MTLLYFLYCTIPNTDILGFLYVFFFNIKNNNPCLYGIRGNLRKIVSHGIACPYTCQTVT